MNLTCDELRQMLGDHFAGELVVEEQTSFQLHLDYCRDCMHYVESYTHTVKITRLLPKSLPLPSTAEARLLEALKDHMGSVNKGS